MKRKPHWSTRFGYFPPRKKRKFVIKTSKEPKQSDKSLLRQRYYKLLSKTNCETLDSIAPFLKQDFEEDIYLSIFPHLILDLFILDPNLFEQEFTGGWMIASQHCPILPHPLVYFDEALSDRLQQIVMSKEMKTFHLLGQTSF